jgi:hypothetical protein
MGKRKFKKLDLKGKMPINRTTSKLIKRNKKTLAWINKIKSKEKIKKLAEEKKKISVNPITHPKTFSEILSALEDVSSLNNTSESNTNFFYKISSRKGRKNVFVKELNRMLLLAQSKAFQEETATAVQYYIENTITTTKFS